MKKKTNIISMWLYSSPLCYCVLFIFVLISTNIGPIRWSILPFYLSICLSVFLYFFRKCLNIMTISVILTRCRRWCCFVFVVYVFVGFFLLVGSSLLLFYFVRACFCFVFFILFFIITYFVWVFFFFVFFFEQMFVSNVSLCWEAFITVIRTTSIPWTWLRG